MPSCFKNILATGSLLILVACSSAPEGIGKIVDAPRHPDKLTDFSGHWEKNYRASDVFMNKYQLYIADNQRNFARGRGAVETNLYDNSAPAFSGMSINGLAQIAEEITRMPLLNIQQDTAGINVQREDDFNLRCLYRDKLFVQSTNPFGSEKCGWNNGRMEFQIFMTGGLRVVHQFSLSPDGAQLNVTSSILSDSVSLPIVISNFYTRFSSQDERYDCKQTLTRNRVCSQQGRSK